MKTEPAPLSRCRALARWVTLLLALLGQCPGFACAQEAKLLPVDEAAADMAWVRFRNALLVALEQHDKSFVLRIVDAKIDNGADAPKGAAEFKKQWDFDSEPKELWTELRRILFLGSVYVPERGSRSQQVCAPYVAIKWPNDYDPYRAGAIVSKDALAKERPSAESRTLATLSYDVVGVADWEVADEDAASPQKWVKLSLKSGAGYVPEEQIRSAVEHRACFRRTNAGWKLTALLAGE
jgi:hypothetical protein